MPLSHKMTMAILTSCLLAAPAFAGYEYPLQSPEIRSAFFLGQRDDDATGAFLSPYGQRISQQQTGRYTIGEIDVLTPYAQIVQRGAKQIPGDSEVQTETDLRTHPLRFLVKINIYFNGAIVDDATNADGAPDGGRTFSAELTQAHKIEPVRTEVEPIYGKHGSAGVRLTLDADPMRITSTPLHITVHTPDGKSVSADFDMSKLK